MTATTLAMLAVFAGSTGAGANVAKWSTPILLDPGRSTENQTGYSVSCPATDFCVVVDGNGHVIYRRRGTWSPPQAVQAGGSFDSVSCLSATFCVAISSGHAVTYDGRSWSKAVKAGPDATYKVSCPNISFCAAVGASGLPGKPSTIATFNGHAWSSQQTSTTGSLYDRLMDVSCATSTFCVAVNLDGQILTYKGARWIPSRTAGPKGLISVSCVTRAFCMAVTDSGHSIMYHGRGWSSPAAIPGFASGFAYSVSCASTTACTTIGLSGRAIHWTAGQWSKPETVFPGGPVAGVAVACSPADVCVAVDDKGRSAVSRT
ncbi:MAG TPA: hypothetical protein VNF08_01525 [Acidimicrobiales bacterium]|nr:hypothetical protein [Acidimicrobiales bacterium]